MPIWLLSTLFTLLAMGINLIGMENYGKVEMFFAWIKIVALLLFIGLIAGMIWAGETQPNHRIKFSQGLSSLAIINCFLYIFAKGPGFS